MNLYFGDFVVTISTVLVLVVWTFIVFNLVRHKKIEFWGRRIAVLALIGLIVCCFVAMRDEYHLSVQASFDESVTAGLFSVTGIQSILCCIGGAIIFLSSFSVIFVKNQKYRKAIFFVLSCIIIFKTLLIEVSRWVV